MIATLPSRALLVAGLIAGSALITGATSAPQGTFVNLSVHEDHSGEVRTAVLTCEPPGGSHPRPAQACADLKAARGDFDALKSQSTQCPLIYKPVTVRAHGTWRAESIDFTKNFANLCVANSKTRGVFDF